MKNKIMNGLKLVGAIVIGVSLGKGCSHLNEDTLSLEVYDNIEAVYWHGSDNYSIAIKNNNNIITMKYLPGQKVILHTGSDKPKAHCKVYVDGWGDRNYRSTYCDLYIGSVDDINPASWNKGKFGRGNIARIE
jgi:hypothetical protein